MNRSWYTKTVDGESSDAVHQIFVFGTLDEIKSLKKKLGEKKLREIFILHPKKIYTKSALNFIKKFILHINKSLNEQKYLKNTPRRIG